MLMATMFIDVCGSLQVSQCHSVTKELLHMSNLHMFRTENFVVCLNCEINSTVKNCWIYSILCECIVLCTVAQTE